jgi:hypothetical protein
MLSSGNIVSPIMYSTLYEVYPTPGSPLREILLIVSSCCNFPLSIVVFYKKFDFGLDPQIPGAKRGSCLVLIYPLEMTRLGALLVENV